MTDPRCTEGRRLSPDQGTLGERLDEESDDWFDDWFEDFVCDRCNNDGMDPWCDYLLPCPACQGEQRGQQ